MNPFLISCSVPPPTALEGSPRAVSLAGSGPDPFCQVSFLSLLIEAFKKTFLKAKFKSCRPL